MQLLFPFLSAIGRSMSVVVGGETELMDSELVPDACFLYFFEEILDDWSCSWSGITLNLSQV